MRVLGAGVKYDAFGVGLYNIIVQALLFLGAYIQGYGINIGMYSFGLLDGYTGNFAGFNAYVNNGVPAAHQSVGGKVSISALVGRSAQY